MRRYVTEWPTWLVLVHYVGYISGMLLQTMVQR